ncbi:competence protein CoiA [Pseudomonas sp. BMS12]|jgi:hypothetical protein|uniref:competence protein CoiA n=1 Tax=Pseudomonas sp. BMS12 TaxID=1796033 RepID=UPI00083A735D|nr:competence protein CoiA family protein [Pseudomonas sp. BMS12]
MPLRCIDENRKSIHSFKMSEWEWEALRQSNAQFQHLSMPCCGRGVVLKKSERGTRFFAHKVRGTCTSASESAEHLEIKQQVCEALIENGWVAETEVRGESREGEEWVADVMASRGQSRFAIEVQWSRQSDKVTVERHSKYKSVGVKALWLHRQEQFLVREQIPAVRVGVRSDGTYEVYAKQMMIHHKADGSPPAPIFRLQGIPIAQFIRALLNRRFWFGSIKAGERAVIDQYASPAHCFYCRRDHQVTSLLIVNGEASREPFWLSYRTLSTSAALRAELLACGIPVSMVASDVCPHCEAKVPDETVQRAAYAQRKVASCTIQVSASLVKAANWWGISHSLQQWRLDHDSLDTEHTY